MGKRREKIGKGQKEEHILCFYKDELIPVLSLGKEMSWIQQLFVLGSAL